MIDLKDLRARPEHYKQGAIDKGFDPGQIDRLLELDAQLRQTISQQQELTAQKNRISKEIGQLAGRLKKAPDAEKAQIQEQIKQLQERPAAIKQQEAALEAQAAQLTAQRDELWLAAPQPADPEAPRGRDESENVELRRWGEVRTFDFEPLDHVELGKRLGIIDIERGVKLAGTRSYFLKGAGTLLHQAVLRLAMDLMLRRGFEPLSVPVLVREPAMVGTGYFPLGREQSYAMTNEDPPLFLVGTAEVSLTAYHMDEILDEAQLPKKYVAMSPCFRREAGTYGKDTHGLYRIHQFDKVEQVIVCRNDAEESRRWHEEIVANAEAVLQALELPYRVVAVCTGDLGQGQAFKYDLETWMPSRQAYGETHSASRFYDFQARRLRLRYRDREGKTQLCHTLNNTVVASPRILIPILELYQNQDGSVTVPAALRPYLNGLERIEPS
ncbi:MAG TPA: serine--tRNA ligase [Phycisphaeraceae bacterium]